MQSVQQPTAPDSLFGDGGSKTNFSLVVHASNNNIKVVDLAFFTYLPGQRRSTSELTAQATYCNDRLCTLVVREISE
ncbi:hypothetical protein L209DRAFT_748103 [Thermothelomyces heterothallicus CBS 203.75]